MKDVFDILPLLEETRANFLYREIHWKDRYCRRHIQKGTWQETLFRTTYTKRYTAKPCQQAQGKTNGSLLLEGQAIPLKPSLKQCRKKIFEYDF